jgi:hypothetical protein
MNRKLVALNLALLALTALLVWQLRVRWVEAQARERAIFTKAVHTMTVIPPPPLTPPKPVPAVEYIDVAQRMLFSKDRNPNVVIEPPPPPPAKPKPPVPPLPSYYGQMSIGEPVILLSDGGAQKTYHAGDRVGPFVIASFDNETIVFRWNGENIEKKISDLAAKEEPSKAAAPAQRPAQAQASSSSAVTSIGGSADSKAADSDKGLLGIDVGGGFYGCKPGDTNPNGAIVNGYKKVVSRGLFGAETCHWEQIK